MLMVLICLGIHNSIGLSSIFPHFVNSLSTPIVSDRHTDCLSTLISIRGKVSRECIFRSIQCIYDIHNILLVLLTSDHNVSIHMEHKVISVYISLTCTPYSLF